MNDHRISVGTIVRTVCLVLALINQVLLLTGKSPLPIEDETISSLISTLATIAASLAAWWKNNSVTKEAIEADKLLQQLKKKENS